MTVSSAILFRCEMLYGTEPCKEALCVDSRKIRNAEHYARAKGWTQFKIEIKAFENGVEVLNPRWRERVDACPMCSYLMGSNPGRNGTQHIDPSVRHELAAASAAHFQANGGHVPAPARYYVLTTGGRRVRCGYLPEVK